MGLETGDKVFKANFSQINNSKKQDFNLEQNLQKILFSVYKIHTEKFNDWMKGKKLTKQYIIAINSCLENTLKLEFTNVLELRDALTKVKNRKYRALALRNLINFCEEYELLDNDLISKLKSKIKITEKSNIDSFIPQKEQVETFTLKVKEYDYLSYLFVKVLLESGLRVSEVQYFFNNIDETKFEVNENVVIYPLYYLRGTKSSYYLFIQKETYLEIIKNLEQIKQYNREKLKTWIKRHKYLHLKYTRKYHFTLMVKAGVQFDIANFIQGRVSQNIGFNVYLAKKEIALNEYRKLFN